MNKRDITIFTGQWADLSIEEMCKVASKIGYDGLELCCWGKHLNIEKAYKDDAYCDEILNVLKKYDLKLTALGTHLIGQVIGDVLDDRHKAFVPSVYYNDLSKSKEWAINQMIMVASVAKKLGVNVVTGFLGSPIWNYWYSYPQTTDEVINDGYKYIKEQWLPIFNEFEKEGVKFAFEVHPAEIAFDYYSAKRLLKELDYHCAFGFNFDPSHLVWQGIKPELFIRDFSDRIFHVHVKDVKVQNDGRAGVLGSMLPFGNTKRGWNFVSIGHGDVNFDLIIRELNSIKYLGPLSIEWEDSCMDRVFGATQSFEYIKKVDFPISTIAFDDAQQFT